MVLYRAHASYYNILSKWWPFNDNSRRFPLKASVLDLFIASILNLPRCKTYLVLQWNCTCTKTLNKYCILPEWSVEFVQSGTLTKLFNLYFYALIRPIGLHSNLMSKDSKSERGWRPGSNINGLWSTAWTELALVLCI